MPYIRNNLDYTAVWVFFFEREKTEIYNFKEKRKTLGDKPNCLINSILSALLLPEAVSLEPECGISLKGHPFP